MTTTSGSSSAESVRKEAPNTPPQIQIHLEPIMATSEPGFDGLFPWHKQNADQPKSDRSAVFSSSADPVVSVEEETYAAAFQHLHSAHLRRDSLQFPQDEGIGSSRPIGSPSRNLELSTFSDPYLNSLPSRSQAGASASSTGPMSLSSADMYRIASAPNTQLRPTFSPDNVASSSLWPLQHQHRASSPARHARPMQADISTEDLSAGGEILDIFSDDRLPGYQVWPRGQPCSSALAVRIPRQLVGWKAILMDAGNFDDAAFSSDAALAKKARRASKVLGKQGWEVRQERLKNSYDFRRGSGIWASMHGGHRLFKHEWHVIVKDGTRYVWRMDKKALALYREEDGVRVAEYRRAVPSSAFSSSDLQRGCEEGYRPDMTRRIGSFKFEAQRSRIRVGHSQDGTIFGLNLALASLMAVFGARGGHDNISAAFEPSTNPLRDVLEQRRQEAPDREEVMLAMPRPGFARDSESVLSDTTDEDAGEPTSGVMSARRAGAHSQQMRSTSPSSPHLGETRTRARHKSEGSAQQRKGQKGARNRLSSFFGRRSSNSAAAMEDDTLSAEGMPMTDSERIARQYRTQGVFS